MVSLHHSYKAGRASLAVMEGLEDIEEIEYYLQAAHCVNCQSSSSVISMLEKRIKELQDGANQREQRFRFMEENSIAWEKKALEYECSLEILIKERGSLNAEMDTLEAKNAKLLGEVAHLHTELKLRPEAPPPPPPPPPPPAKFRFWRPHKKQRSKSLNRVEDLKGGGKNPHAPMVLNSDILDAIKNRRYSLRHVDPTKEKEKTRRLRKEQFHSDFNIAKILERQIALAFSEDESDGEEDQEWILNKDKNGSFSSLDSNGSFSPRFKNIVNKTFSSF